LDIALSETLYFCPSALNDCVRISDFKTSLSGLTTFLLSFLEHSKQYSALLLISFPHFLQKCLTAVLVFLSIKACFDSTRLILLLKTLDNK
jgi:hypothetical protein